MRPVLSELSDVPSSFVQNLISRMHIEGLDPPRPNMKTKQSQKGWTSLSRPAPIMTPPYPYLPPTPPSHLPPVPSYILPPTPPSHLSPTLPSYLSPITPSQVSPTPTSHISPIPQMAVPAHGLGLSQDILRSIEKITGPLIPQPQHKTASSDIPDLIKVNKSSDKKVLKTRQKSFNRKDIQGPRVYSDDLSDCCKHRCQICQKEYGVTAMRFHAKNKHGTSIREYQEEYGNIKENMTKVVWHKCKLCPEEFLLDTDDIHRHATIKHQISLKEYNFRFTISAKNKGWFKLRNSSTPPVTLTPPPSETKVKKEKEF